MLQVREPKDPKPMDQERTDSKKRLAVLMEKTTVRKRTLVYTWTLLLHPTMTYKNSKLARFDFSTENMRVRWSCGKSVARECRVKDFQLKNTRNELLEITLEALIVPEVGANLFSVVL